MKQVKRPFPRGEGFEGEGKRIKGKSQDNFLTQGGEYLPGLFMLITAGIKPVGGTWRVSSKSPSAHPPREDFYGHRVSNCAFPDRVRERDC